MSTHFTAFQSRCLGVALGLACAATALPQQILYTISQDGNREIYTMNLDGSNKTRLTNTPEDELAPIWQPVRSKVSFYTSFNDLPGGAFVMNADGSGRASTPSYGELSPDGELLLYASGLGLVYEAMPGSDPTILLPIETGSFGNVKWAADSFQILYARNEQGAFPYDAIYVTNWYGDPPKRIAAGRIQEASWSPDGTKILVVFEESIAVFAAAAPADSPPLAMLHTGRSLDAAWSPDGSRIAFITLTNNSVRVLEVSAGGGAAHLLKENFGAPAYNLLRYAPDGSKILLDNPDFPSESYGAPNIFSLDVSSKTLTTLAAGGEFGDFIIGGDLPTINGAGVVLSNLLPAVQTISPLSIVSVFGKGFSAASLYNAALDESGKIATKLGGSCVEVDGKRAPIFAMLPNQANIQAPGDLPLGPVPVSVIRNCDTAEEVRSNAVMVTVEQASPAFFLYAPYASDGYIAARLNDGFAAVAPEGAIADQQGASRPARPGESISLFGTGWGQTTAPLATGEIAAAATSLIDAAGLTVTFDGVPLDTELDVEYAGIAPGVAGVYQLAIRVPANAQPGNHQIGITVHGRSSPMGPVIPVAP